MFLVLVLLLLAAPALEASPSSTTRISGMVIGCVGGGSLDGGGDAADKGVAVERKEAGWSAEASTPDGETRRHSLGAQQPHRLGHQLRMLPGREEEDVVDRLFVENPF